MIDGAMNGEGFYTYVEKVLCPELKKGDIVVCDNLASHKMKGIKELIESVGAQIRYLPPYSPDLNPIEMAFSKLKNFMKKKAARTFETLQDATAQALDTITPAICSNFLSHANYAATYLG
jgi:transposase